jgi:hypothetical protein
MKDMDTDPTLKPGNINPDIKPPKPGVKVESI